MNFHLGDKQNFSAILTSFLPSRINRRLSDTPLKKVSRDIFLPPFFQIQSQTKLFITFNRFPVDPRFIFSHLHYTIRAFQTNIRFSNPVLLLEILKFREISSQFIRCNSLPEGNAVCLRVRIDIDLEQEKIIEASKGIKKVSTFLPAPDECIFYPFLDCGHQLRENMCR